MKLFTWEIAPNPRRVKIFLDEKGVKIPSEDVGVAGKPFLEPNFLKKHPAPPCAAITLRRRELYR